jgi:hypothetical protein
LLNDVTQTLACVLDTFHKLLPFGAKDNIRLVIVNRRDYVGSTKYTDDNLKDLNEGKAAFMERLGAEVAHLLIWFAETHKIPKISADGKSGGISVMGWSIGTATPMALLAYPDFIGKDTCAKLEPYFRQLILYGMFSDHISDPIQLSVPQTPRSFPSVMTAPRGLQPFYSKLFH